MMDFIDALTRYGFLQGALIAGLLTSIGCGVMGSYVVVKRIAFIAGSIAHSVLGGMGIALYMGSDPLIGALISAIIAALLIGGIRLYWKQQEDTLIGALWAIGMAIGVIFIAKTPGYQSDLTSYLFGNILLVPHSSLWFMAGLDVVLLAIVWAYHRQLLAVVFDEEHARLRGIPASFFYLLLLSDGCANRCVTDSSGWLNPGACADYTARCHGRSLCEFTASHDVARHTDWHANELHWACGQLPYRSSHRSCDRSRYRLSLCFIQPVAPLTWR